MAKRKEESPREERRRAERARRKEERRSGAAAEHRRPLPNLRLLLPALAGVLLAGYLSAVHWTGGSPAACAAGSGCDLVQSSRFATFAGVPTAAWGLAGYAALAGVALFVRPRRGHGLLAVGLAGAGLAVSLYLTAVSVLAIGATCLWCLASLGIMAVCFGVALPELPEGPRAEAWPLGAVAGVTALALVGLHLHYQGVFDPMDGPEDPHLRALAEHLADEGARFYGAQWCPHCNHQKELFGPSAERLPYVECAPEGPRTPLAEPCREADVDRYPTWVIDGERHEGLLSPERLAKLSGFSEGEGSAEGRPEASAGGEARRGAGGVAER